MEPFQSEHHLQQSLTDSSDPPGSVWARLVQRIQAGDAAAVEELYARFERGVRYFFYRRLGSQDLEDRVHESFLILLEAIRKGELRDPRCLVGFLRTVVRRQVAASIDAAVQQRKSFNPLETTAPIQDPNESPEELLMRRQRYQIMKKVLGSISKRDREILVRFYLLEQTPAQICAEMNLTPTQFRLLKSRAKARFGELGRQTLSPSPLRKLLLRKSATASH